MNCGLKNSEKQICPLREGASEGQEEIMLVQLQRWASYNESDT